MTDKPGRAPVSRLTTKQRAAVIEWIGEGAAFGEIARRAKAFKPPFKITKQHLQYYRARIGKPELERRKTENAAAFAKGFALKEKRILALDRLAHNVLRDLKKTGLWLLQGFEIKGSGDEAEYIQILKFNSAEIDSFRSLLDDIAREQGARNARGLALDIPPGGRIKFIVGVDEAEL